MKKKKNKDVKEPDWLDPKNDRKTPYTEKELDMFVDGVIDNMKDVNSINKAIDEEGLLETRRILKQAFREMDPYYNKKDNWNYFITIRYTGQRAAYLNFISPTAC